MSRTDQRLAELGLKLADPPAPAANYLPYVTAGNLVWVSGQISADGDGPITGRLGETLDLDAGRIAARSCALALLSQLRAACGGDLDRVTRVVKLTGFVSCTPDFTAHPQVINAASDLFADVFGEAGRHARAAVGAPSLPLGVAVEIEGVFAIA